MQTNTSTAKRYLQSWWVRTGLILFVLGCGPLVAVMVAAALGFTDDPNPNPVIFGIMAGLTFWPAVALIIIGLFRTKKALKAA